MDPDCPASRTVVMKFGGTSVQDAAVLGRLVSSVASEPRRRIIVVSALAGVTDALCGVTEGRVRGAAAGETMHRLLERHVALVRELVAAHAQGALVDRLRARFEEAARVIRAEAPSPEESDAVLAVGELAGSELVAAVLSAAGLPAAWVDAREVIVTDDLFGQARPRPDAIRAAYDRSVEPLLAVGRVPVLGGFIGATPDGATTTLGRGGSDYSAALVAAAASAEEIQIWTDVDGVLDADPRVIARASRIDRLSFQEAYEMARFGAKVLHWGTLQPAAAHDIPVRVLSSRGDGVGTTICARARRNDRADLKVGPYTGNGGADVWRTVGADLQVGPARSPVVGLAHQVGVTVADVRARRIARPLGLLREALDWLAGEGDRVTVVSLSATRLVVVTTQESSIDRLLVAIHDLADVRVVRNAATVTAVGNGIAGHASVWSVLTAAVYARHAESVVAADSGDALVCVTSRALAPRLLSHLYDACWPVDRPSARGADRVSSAEARLTRGPHGAGAVGWRGSPPPEQSNPKTPARRSRNQTPRWDQEPVSASDTNAPEVVRKDKIWRVSVTGARL
ncbi:MAG: aspartate kinase [Acidobacteria bacterium]|nr:aspartate kinase [Acidobacteriota bacterium]